MQPIEGNILNLWNICREGTRALGPGLRYVIWAQGCLKRCFGCTSPESQPIQLRMVVGVEELATDIIKRQNLCGITISGGEPFLQASSFVRLLKLVKFRRSEMSVIVFTGYQKEDLIWSEAQEFMNQIDVLIDGPFCHEKKFDRGMRGSLNQRIHFLTDALENYREELENGSRKLDVYVERDEIITIGIPNTKQNMIV